MRFASKPGMNSSRIGHAGRLVALSTLMAVAAIAPAFAGDVVVICNLDVKLQSTEVKDVFIGEKVFAGSVRLVPVDNAALQAGFLDKVMKIDAGKYTGIWTKKSFRDGANPPAVKANDSEVIAFVKATVGACGYVASEPAGVAVIGKF
jgi:hypothetical protein